MGRTDLVARLRATGPHLSIGILNADLLHLADELALLERAGVRIVHTDVGDGVFSPMFTVGAPFVKAQRTTLLKDAHLMIEEPVEKVQAFVDAGADIITFGVEGTRHPHRVLQVLDKALNANDPERGIVRGVALNLGTAATVVEPLLGDLEYVLLLAVNPGWSGQSYSSAVENKLAAVRQLVDRSGQQILLGIDGGITKENVRHVAGLGVDVIVTGSAVFDGKAPQPNAQAMLQAVRSVLPSQQLAPERSARGGPARSSLTDGLGRLCPSSAAVEVAMRLKCHALGRWTRSREGMAAQQGWFLSEGGAEKSSCPIVRGASRGSENDRPVSRAGCARSMEASL